MIKKTFGLTKTKHKDRKWYISYLNIPFIVILILSFSFFAFYHTVTDIVFSKNKIDVFTQDLNKIAFYFSTIDEDFADFLLIVDDIIQSYIQGDNIFKTKTTDIEKARSYIKDNREYITKLWYSNYEEVMEFLSDARKYKDTIFNLFGKEQTYNYLVILQNSNEKRPNGWFFWSFAFISVYQWFIKDLRIIDAYYPDFIAYRTSLTAPEWTTPFLPERKIGFIAANKFWFTDIDGKNIKDLYELMFNKTYEMKKVKATFTEEQADALLNKDIKWVIFIQTDLIEYLIPWFNQKVRERQFLNASIDLIRGEYRGNKKEEYIQEVEAFFKANQQTIAKNFINKFPTIIKNNMIHIYLSNVDDKINGLLQKRGLSNVYSQDFIYAWDTNNSFNKVDNFVDKTIQIVDQDDNIIVDTKNDKVAIDELNPWTYTIHITYTLQVPNHYIQFIENLEKKYDIQLTERERWILAIQANTLPEWAPIRRWQSRSTIYIPSQFTINNIQGDMLEQNTFQAPFAKGIYYLMRIVDNNTSKKISITFTK